MSVPRLPVVLTDEARDDFQAIDADGLLNWGEEQAERYHAAIEEVFESLARFPRMGRRRQELGGDIRSMVVRHHSVFYRIDRDRILVLRILHERMDVIRHFKL